MEYILRKQKMMFQKYPKRTHLKYMRVLPTLPVDSIVFVMIRTTM